MNESKKRDTLADIVEEIRAYGAQPPPRLMWLEIADRIETAWERERTEIEAQALSIGGMPGNAAAMREAMEMARDALKSAEKYVYGDPPNGGAIGWDDVWPSEWHNALEAVERALSAPARQCDVGTAEEQEKRYKLKREVYHTLTLTNALAWAQTPYEEGGAE